MTYFNKQPLTLKQPPEEGLHLKTSFTVITSSSNFRHCQQCFSKTSFCFHFCPYHAHSSHPGQAQHILYVLPPASCSLHGEHLPMPLTISTWPRPCPSSRPYLSPTSPIQRSPKLALHSSSLTSYCTFYLTCYLSLHNRPQKTNQLQTTTIVFSHDFVAQEFGLGWAQHAGFLLHLMWTEVIGWDFILWMSKFGSGQHIPCLAKGSFSGECHVDTYTWPPASAGG